MRCFLLFWPNLLTPQYFYRGSHTSNGRLYTRESIAAYCSRFRLINPYTGVLEVDPEGNPAGNDDDGNSTSTSDDESIENWIQNNRRRRLNNGRSQQSSGRQPRSTDNNSSSRAPRTRFGGFLNQDETAIKNSAMSQALISILQIASGNPQGLSGALGHGHRTNWINDNLNGLFGPDGPLAAYKTVSAAIFAKHLRKAEKLAKSYYQRDHSNDPTGSQQEDVPAWATAFYPLFDGSSAQEASNRQAQESRERMRGVTRSLIGAQAPLGVEGQGVASLRTETSANQGAPVERQQYIGRVSVQRVDEYDNHEMLQEGVDDSENREPAGSQRSGNYNRFNANRTRRRNVGAPFGADHNDPSARFAPLNEAYSSMRDLNQTIREAIATQRVSPPPPRPEIAFSDDYSRIAQMRDAATTEEDRDFYNFQLSQLRSRAGIPGSSE